MASRDLYGSTGGVQDVAPSLTGGGVPFSVRATPNSFGAQVQEAREFKGQTASQVGESRMEVGMKQMGMVNETIATNADTDYMQKLGELEGGLKQKTGPEAVAALPEYIKSVTDLRQKVRGQLPGGAARAFDLNAIRREGYAIIDAQNYVAGQIKAGHQNSAMMNTNQQIRNAGRASVAQDDYQFNDTLGHIHANIASQFIDHPGISQDPDTGMVKFADNDDGKQAKADYMQRLDASVGDAYINRYMTLEALHGTIGSYDKYKQDKANIPLATQAKLDSYFEPRVKDAAARHIAGVGLAQTQADYLDSVSSPEAVRATNERNALYRSFSTQESNNNPNSPTSVDGAVGQYQILPATFAQYAKPGERIDNPKDNAAVGKRILDDYSSRYKTPDGKTDMARVAVAYFSGPGNVAPAGSDLPYLKDTVDGNGKSVSSYVDNITNNAASNKMNPHAVPSEADWYREHYDDILEKTEQAARNQFPDDEAYVQKAVANQDQYMRKVINRQEFSVKLDKDKVLKALNGDLSNGHRPETVDELEAISPEVKAALSNTLNYDSKFYDTVTTRLLSSNARRDNNTNSSNYYYNLKKILGGEEVYTENYLHSLLGRTDGTGINLKDYQDLRDMMDDANKMNGWTDFLDKNVRAIESANGNVDGNGEKRAMAFVQMVERARKSKEGKGVQVSDMTNPDSSEYLGDMADKFVMSREQQIASAAKVARQSPPVPELKIGDIYKGYKLIGTDKSKPESWERVQ